MLKILYFAHLREQLGRECDDLVLPDGVANVAELIEFLKHYKPDVNEAEYQGRKVKLGKPTRGDVKKFKVYVKNPKGNVVKVNFGHKGKGGEKTMRIKKSDPERRK